MPIDVSGFVSKPQEFEGLYRAGEMLQKNRLRDEELRQRQDVRKQATSTFLSNYLDPKDHLTGTNYDPEIVSQLNEAMQQGVELAAKGADTASIMMALGPKVNKISEYSTKAKLIDQQIKNSVTRLKPYKGYNIEALEQQAKKAAFYDETGKLKDISLVDPSEDWVSEAKNKNRSLVTTSAGLDDFVKNTPAAEYSRNVKTTFAGKSKETMYDAKHPFWMDLAKNDKGEIATDNSGNPIGLEVVGSNLVGDDNKPIINPETNKPYKVMNKDHFNAIMNHNEDIADFIKGQVEDHFKAAGAKTIPAEGSPQWDMMASAILHDELAARNNSSFKVRDRQTQTDAVSKVQMMQDPATAAALTKIANIGDNNSGGSKTDVVATLDEYPVVEGKKDITDIFDGVVVGKDEYGNGILMSDVLFDPATKKISYNGKPPVSVAKFIQDNRLQGKELKIAQSLEKYKMSDKKAEPEKKAKEEGGFFNSVKNFFKGTTTKAPATKAPASKPVKKVEDLRKKYNY